MVKRSASSSPSPPPSSQTLSTPSKNAKSTSTTPHTLKGSPVKIEHGSHALSGPGAWPGVKKAELLDKLISVGLAHSNTSELAAQARKGPLLRAHGDLTDLARDLDDGNVGSTSYVPLYTPLSIYNKPHDARDTWKTNMVKRSPSTSPSPAPKLDIITPTKKTKKTPNSSPVKLEVEKVGSGKNDSGATMTGEKKGALIEHLLAVGLANTKLDDLASQFGASKEQIRNMTRTGKSNLRKKVVDFARSL